MSIDVRWVAVFADVPAAWLPKCLEFWTVVCGARRGTPTGDDAEFIPLQPAAGDGYLYLQRVGRDVGGWHLDLSVSALDWAVQEAQARGARLVRAGRSVTVLESPAGQPFCLYADQRPARSRPSAPTWPGVGRSLADQLCLDIPFDAYETECIFWSALTGWPYRATDEPQFRRINPPRALPVQLLLQRLGVGDAGDPRAHLDMSADGPAAEVARHVRLGATVVAELPHWTTLRDPAGLTYCVTHRRPYEPNR